MAKRKAKTVPKVRKPRRSAPLVQVDGTTNAQLDVIRSEVVPLLRIFPVEALTSDVACEALRVIGKLVEPRPLSIVGCTIGGGCE